MYVDNLIVVVHEELVAMCQHLDLLPKVGNGLHLPLYVFLALVVMDMDLLSKKRVANIDILCSE